MAGGEGVGGWGGGKDFRGCDQAAQATNSSNKVENS